ncbi:4-hydroxythreonine-4-phosphate dehydrogenase [Sulfurifustis variabilis]|uniref:4-hydroxythreonine-4-phosphate dehydrogenase n=1 Tax=Sulfurifustis variabilis TaxID=1675686 RepID=A0A1C7AFL6_9GAMM|nr:4-hydroxythreonine-4-phosphate dehydrogenase PdxA [Sulfurifustis variabilis]BAU50145.1 4-hydroxythreonine-4-phosphate dehydrogenase [Sulfurifustis variabilis]
MPAVIAVTPGEPAGIGPDVCVGLAARETDACLVYVGDPAVIAARAQLLGRSFAYSPWRGRALATPGHYVLPVSAAHPVAAGRLDPGNAAYVVATLEQAIDGCLAREFDALVTGPVHKGAINDAGIAFTGHTELLGDRCGAEPVMMLACPGLRVALATTHLPLREVSRHITRERLERVIRVLHRDLVRRFGLADPVIAVCGLNPHAGESGHLGSEETEVIGPALDRLRAQGLRLRGPLPADTAFIPQQLEGVDAVLAMYHDQGLPVLKHHDFAHAVNITLGLPFPRTSVDHGTALELAGTGRADPSSLYAAVQAALKMVRAAHERG